MWQYLIVGLLVIAAALYAARALGPRRWRGKGRGGAVVKGAAGDCGCTKDGKPCH
jgi:hypothetical protein